MGPTHARTTSTTGRHAPTTGAPAPVEGVQHPRGYEELAPGGITRSSGLLVVALGVLAARSVLATLVPDEVDQVISAVVQVLVAALAGGAVLVGVQSAGGEHRHYGIRVLVGLALVLLLGLADGLAAVLPTEQGVRLLLIGAASLLAVVQLSPLVSRGEPAGRMAIAWLDLLVFFAAGLAIMAAAIAWTGTSATGATMAAVAMLVGMLAWTATVATMLVARGVPVRWGGPLLLLCGVALVSVAGTAWVATADAGALALGAWVDIAFGMGACMIARGWLTWSLDAVPRQHAWLAEAARDLASTLAVMTSVVVLVLGPALPSGSRASLIAQAALLAGVLAAGVRQVVVRELERRARVRETAAHLRLESELEYRGRVAQALEGVEPTGGLAMTAARICDRLATLPWVDFAVITALPADGDAVPLAATGLHRSGLVGEPLGPDHADRLRRRVAQGPWTEPVSPALDPWLPAGVAGSGAEVTRVSMPWEGAVVGVLAIGGVTPGDAAAAGRRLATAREAAVLTAALIGPLLVAEGSARRDRERIDRVIDEGAFTPVFQPIVELATGRPVGFEALTRFADGRRADQWFAEANEAGRGVALEIATLRAATRASADLPEECYLSLNLSAETASSVELIGPVLTRLPRKLLLEITEHVPVEDYERLMATLYALDIHLRLAVDDAGAGYAGLQHILQIRPHVVKLDTVLVKGVHADVARQAIVGAMVTFAAKTGSTIVAEGVETPADVAMLRSLGVELGQGFLLGEPRPAGYWRVPEQPV